MHEIKKREMGWGTLHEVHMEGWCSPLATLTVDKRSAFGEPQPPSINWSAIGSQPASVTKAFAAALLELSAIVEAAAIDAEPPGEPSRKAAIDKAKEPKP